MTTYQMIGWIFFIILFFLVMWRYSKFIYDMGYDDGLWTFRVDHARSSTIKLVEIHKLKKELMDLKKKKRKKK